MPSGRSNEDRTDGFVLKCVKFHRMVSCGYNITYPKVSGLRLGTLLWGFGKHCIFATELKQKSNETYNHHDGRSRHPRHRLQKQ